MLKNKIKKYLYKIIKIIILMLKKNKIKKYIYRMIKIIILMLKNVRPINYIRLVLYNILIVGYTIVYMDSINDIFIKTLNYITPITNELLDNMIICTAVILNKLFSANLFKKYSIQSNNGVNISIDVYKYLYSNIKKVLQNKIETIKLTLIWKIKRSNNFLIKIVKKFLNKYAWFANNIIKF